MKARLTERSERKSLPEFDPPPLLERTVGLKMMGFKKEKRFIRRRPRALPVDECEKAFASAGCSPRGKAPGNPSADNPDEYGKIIVP